ncbi:hypothetical protein [Pelagibacterium halotolerans]|uniref:hypothetical protein n=1 Tax=Pelagibacterium halotolerans TaxID=531813 RepID=UPI00384FD4A7
MRPFGWVSVLVCASMAEPALAQERWETYSFPETGTDAAIVVHDSDAALAVRCQDDVLDILYQIRREDLDKVFKGHLNDAYLVLYADDADAGYLWAEVSIEVDDQDAWAIFVHENVTEWAQEVASARQTVTAAFSLDALADRLELYNETEFTARGSTATSNEIVAGCGR